jgi:hypothetical protein
MSSRRDVTRQVAIPKLREGEGAPAHFTTQHIAGVDGTHSVVFQVDIASAPVPDRKYAADGIGILERDGEYKLIFVQRELVGEGYVSMLVVHMSQDAIDRIADAVSNLMPGITQFLEGAKIAVGDFVDLGHKAAQTVGFAANIVACGYASREATMDFYQTSSFAWEHAMKSQHSLAVSPIVRVSLPTRLMARLFMKIQEWRKEEP